MRYSDLALSEPYPISHDSISRWLHDKCFKPRDLWEIAKTYIDSSEPILLICHGTVLAKTRSQKIDLVNYEYSGNAHDVIAGIGLINLLSKLSLLFQLIIEFMIKTRMAKLITLIFAICYPLPNLEVSILLPLSWTLGIQV